MAKDKKYSLIVNWCFKKKATTATHYNKRIITKPLLIYRQVRAIIKQCLFLREWKAHTNVIGRVFLFSFRKNAGRNKHYLIKCNPCRKSCIWEIISNNPQAISLSFLHTQKTKSKYLCLFVWHCRKRKLNSYKLTSFYNNNQLGSFWNNPQWAKTIPVCRKSAWS